MSPLLRPGDLLLLTPPSRLTVGDVVLLEDPRSEEAPQLIAHRIIGQRAELFLTRGDAVRRQDIPRPMNEILARVIGARRQNHRLRFGFGPERRILAVMSRFGILRPLLVAAVWMRRAFSRKT